MRIKSYFAPSVQAAIALARKEFGDGVTLVTSHVASLDNRHLGEYEVVFAIEEVAAAETPAPEPVSALTPAPAIESVIEPAPVFDDLLRQAIFAPAPMHRDLPEKLEQIHSSLVALGLDASLVRSFMTMLKAVLPATSAASETPAGGNDPMIDEPVVSSLEVALSVPETLAEPVIQYVLQPVAAQPVASRIVATQFDEPVEIPGDRPVLVLKQPEPRPFLSLFETPRPSRSSAQPRFSAAELAFMSSVSSPKEQGA